MSETEVRTWRNGLVRQCVAIMEKSMEGNDPSHDAAHVHRVTKLANAIAAKEVAGSFSDTWYSLEIRRMDMADGWQLVVEIAALFHDVNDWKYADASAVSVTQLVKEAVSSQGPTPAFLSGGEDKLATDVTYVVDHVSFSKELSPGYPKDLPIELKIVQDADRLEAIGAIGICRCFTYGGKKDRPFYDDDDMSRAAAHIAAKSTDDVCTDLKQADYMQQNRKASTVSHFDEKLFKLLGMMKTETGKAIGQQRHDFMKQFTDQFYREILCLDV